MTTPTFEPYQPPDPDDLTQLVQPSRRTPPPAGRPDLQVELAAKVLVPVVVLLLFLVGFLMVQVGGLTDESTKATKAANDAVGATTLNREVGYKNRAVDCATLVMLGGRDSLPAACTEEGPLEYYDPDAIPVVLTPGAQGHLLDLVCNLNYPGNEEAQEICRERAD